MWATVKLKEFFKNRWLIFVCAMWVQSCAGVGYLFGSISPVIKSTMGYNQRQVALLGVAKDLGDSIGFLAGSLCEILPIWGILVIGVVQNFAGYGLLWLVVIGDLPSLPLWVLCLLVFIGTNGETYFNTATLVSCVQNFPKNRGPVVGILKGFAGLSGAILTQIYLMMNFSSESSLIFMVAVWPSIAVLVLMFVVRPVRGGHRQVRPSDWSSFLFTYGVCLLLAVYMLGVLLVEDIVDISQTLITLFAAILLVMVFLPVAIPVMLVFFSEPVASAIEALPMVTPKDEPAIPSPIMSEVEEEKPADVDLLPAAERRKRMAQLQSKLFHAAAEGAVRVNRRRGPHRGEDFTLFQALIKADFWLNFFSLMLAAGSGVTVIDNLGQICESLGYTEYSIFVSMISIWNFLGRVGGGYLSEITVRNLSLPRPAAMAMFQLIMAVGFFYSAMGWPGEIYVLTVLVGLGYGAHWAVIPATASELFGLKSFGALYNFLTLANPAGSLIFSGVIASGIYDYYAEKQAALAHKVSSKPLLALVPFLGDDSLTCTGSVCYSITFGILAVLCVVAMVLSLVLVRRTRSVYAQLYRSSPN